MSVLTGVVMDRFTKSFKEHPALTVFCMTCCSFVMLYSVKIFASKLDLADHVKEANLHFSAFEDRLDRLEFGIAARSLETEIFELERIIETGSSREIDHKRLNKLRNELKRLESN